MTLPAKTTPNQPKYTKRYRYTRTRDARAATLPPNTNNITAPTTKIKIEKKQQPRGELETTRSKAQQERERLPFKVFVSRRSHSHCSRANAHPYSSLPGELNVPFLSRLSISTHVRLLRLSDFLDLICSCLFAFVFLELEARTRTERRNRNTYSRTRNATQNRGHTARFALHR